MRILGEAAQVVGVGLLGALLAFLLGAVPAAPEEAGACGGGPTEGAALTWVSPADARPLLGTAGVVFVDARDRAEYRSGHVAGSVHTPVVGGVVRDGALEPLRGATTVVAYCDSSEQCARSVRLAGILTEAGFPDVRVLEGGFPAWLDAGYPAEAGEH